MRRPPSYISWQRQQRIRLALAFAYGWLSALGGAVLARWMGWF